jgi:hypothetical protein
MSLIELVVIIFILSLGAAMVIPLAADQGINQLNKASYRLIADIQYVQSQAIGSRTAQSLVFNISQGEYYFPPAGDPTQFKTDPYTKKDYRVFFHNATINTTLEVKSHTEEFPDISLVSVNFGGENSVYFDSLGLPTDSGGNPLSTATIQIRGSNLTRTLAIDTSTGRVTIN